jgi:L-amino acid N-acyltransferase YncA
MRPDDRDRLFAFFRALPVKDRRYFRHDVSQREVITNWCKNLDFDRTLPILVTMDDHGQEKIIADGTLHTERHGWSTHVAEIRMVVTPKYRTKGVGRILLRELYDLAIAKKISKIQTSVRADAGSSLAMVKKLGFKKEVVLTKQAIDTSGRRHDVIVMYNDLDELWSLMEDINLDYDFHVVP